jgi:hypothetical protein
MTVYILEGMTTYIVNRPDTQPRLVGPALRE